MITADMVGGFTVKNVQDPRGALERLNRQSLVWLMKSNGIHNISESMPKTHLLKIADLEHSKLVTYREDGGFSYNNVSAYKEPSDGSIRIRRPSYMDEVKPDGALVQADAKQKKVHKVPAKEKSVANTELPEPVIEEDKLVM